MNKEENMEIRTLETFVKGVKEEGASEPCKYVQFNRQEAQRLLDYITNLQQRIDKAIEYVEELISDTKGIINAYNYEDKEKTIKSYIEDLETDIKDYEYLEYILRGEENEK